MDIETSEKYLQHNLNHLIRDNYYSSDESNAASGEYGIEREDYQDQNHNHQGIFLNKSINLGQFGQQNGDQFYQNNMYQQQLNNGYGQEYQSESNGSLNSSQSNQQPFHYKNRTNSSQSSEYPNSNYSSYESSSNLNTELKNLANGFNFHTHQQQHQQSQNNSNSYLQNSSSQQQSQMRISQPSFDEEQSSNSAHCSQQTTEQQDVNEDQQKLVKKDFKEVEFVCMPLLKNLRQREIYLIYGEILIELDSIFEMNILDRNSGYNHFKKVQSVKQRQDNGYVEIIFDTFAEPLRDFQFLINRIRNIPDQKAYDLSKIIEQYYTLVQKQLAEDELHKLQYSEALIHARHQHCSTKSEELISMLDENANVFYYQCRMNPKTFEPINFKQGFSRKLSWVFGCSPEVLVMLYMRYGQLDFTKCASKIEMTMQKVLSNFSDMFKERFMRENNYQARDKNIDNIISQNILEMEMQSIDDLMIPMTCIVSRISLSQDFDDMHGIKGLMPECLLVIDVKIDIRFMHMLIKHRCEQLPTQDHYIKTFIESHKICENEEYFNQSKDFLDRFYPKDEDQGKVMIKPKFKKNTNNPQQNLYNNGNKVSDETLNQIYSILQQRN